VRYKLLNQIFILFALRESRWYAIFFVVKSLQ